MTYEDIAQVQYIEFAEPIIADQLMLYYVFTGMLRKTLSPLVQLFDRRSCSSYPPQEAKIVPLL